MRSFLALAAAGVVAMLLQTGVFPALPYLPVRPDLILVLAGYLGVRHHNAGGALGAFTLGYFLDTFSGTILGMQTFAISAAGDVTFATAPTATGEGVEGIFYSPRSKTR